MLLRLERRHIKDYQSHINKEEALPSLVNEPIALWFDVGMLDECNGNPSRWRRLASAPTTCQTGSWLDTATTALSTTSNDCRFHSHSGLSSSQHDVSNQDGIPPSSFHPVQLKLGLPNPAPPEVDAFILARPVSVSDSQHGQLAENSSDCLAQLFTRTG